MARQKAVSEDIEKLIKRANQRLRQLEKDELANTSKAYQYIMNKALKNMASKSKTKMFSYTASGDIKFRTDLATLKKQNKNVYKALINVATGFTEAHTSTRIGIEDANKKSYEGFVNKTGFTGDFAEFSDLWKNKEFELLTKKFGVSDTITLAQDLADKFSMEFDDVISLMKDSNATSEEGVREFVEDRVHEKI